METACRITDQHVRMAGLGRRHRVVDHGRRIRALLLGDDLHSGPVGPLGQLLDGRRPEGILRRQHHPFAAVLQLTGQLADGGGLAHAVDADHQHHGAPVLELISIFP